MPSWLDLQNAMREKEWPIYDKLKNSWAIWTIKDAKTKIWSSVIDLLNWIELELSAYKQLNHILNWIELELSIFKQLNHINESFSQSVIEARIAWISEEELIPLIEEYEEYIIEAIKAWVSVIEARIAWISEEELTPLIKEYEEFKK